MITRRLCSFLLAAAFCFGQTTDKLLPQRIVSTAPSINSTNGTLTYQAAANSYGTATFSVTLVDNGGTANNATGSYTQAISIPLPLSAPCSISARVE